MRLVNDHGDRFAQADWPPLAAAQGAAISRRDAAVWPASQPALDRRALWLPADVPPGRYGLELVVYSTETGRTLGQPVTITSIEVKPAEIVVPLRSLSIPTPTLQPAGDLTLVGYAMPQSLQPGESLPLWLYWQASPQGDWTLSSDSVIRLSLIGLDDAGRHPSVPQEALFPLVESVGRLTGWQPGQVRRAVYHLLTHPRLTSGRAAASVSLIAVPFGENPPGQATVNLPPITLKQRARQFEPPNVPRPTEITFGSPSLIKLVGHDLAEGTRSVRPGNTLSVTLYWQALTETEINYTVFVQVLDVDWHVVAQQDLQPLDGAAPTNTWLAGEYLTDPYRLSLPADLHPGDYRVISGLYDARTGKRLSVSSGGDFVELGMVTVPSELQGTSQ